MSARRPSASGEDASGGNASGARGALESWLRSHPDAAGPGGPGDSQAKTLVVAGALWFCATLAIGAILASVTVQASGDETVLVADVDWNHFVAMMLAWVAALNVPVWVLAWRRQRRDSGGGRTPGASN